MEQLNLNIVKRKLWGLLQIGYGIRDYYWRDYWDNIGGNYWIIVLGEIMESWKVEIHEGKWRRAEYLQLYRY